MFLTVGYWKMMLVNGANPYLYYLNEFCSSLTVVEHCIYWVIEIAQGAERHGHRMAQGLSSQGDLNLSLLRRFHMKRTLTLQDTNTTHHQDL